MQTAFKALHPQTLEALQLPRRRWYLSRRMTRDGARMPSAFWTAACGSPPQMVGTMTRPTPQSTPRSTAPERQTGRQTRRSCTSSSCAAFWLPAAKPRSAKRPRSTSGLPRKPLWPQVRICGLGHGKCIVVEKTEDEYPYQRHKSQDIDMAILNIYCSPHFHLLALCFTWIPQPGTESKIDNVRPSYGCAGLMVMERNFLDVYPYTNWGGNSNLPVLQQGDTFSPSELQLQEVSFQNFCV